MRKTLVILTLLILACLTRLAAQTVDIMITKQSADTLELTLHNPYQQLTVLSGVVFTIKWDASYQIAFGNISNHYGIQIAPSGPVLIENDCRYQIFSGVGLQAAQLPSLLVITIPIAVNNHNHYLELTNDTRTNNGSYYVSLGGVDVTGKILQIDRSIPASKLTTLYFDSSTNNYIVYLSTTGFYYNMQGQLVTVRDSRALIEVLK